MEIEIMNNINDKFRQSYQNLITFGIMDKSTKIRHGNSAGELEIYKNIFSIDELNNIIRQAESEDNYSLSGDSKAEILEYAKAYAYHTISDSMNKYQNEIVLRMYAFSSVLKECSRKMNFYGNENDEQVYIVMSKQYDNIINDYSPKNRITKELVQGYKREFENVHGIRILLDKIDIENDYLDITKIEDRYKAMDIKQSKSGNIIENELAYPNYNSDNTQLYFKFVDMLEKNKVSSEKIFVSKIKNENVELSFVEPTFAKSDFMNKKLRNINAIPDVAGFSIKMCNNHHFYNYNITTAKVDLKDALNNYGEDNTYICVHGEKKLVKMLIDMSLSAGNSLKFELTEQNKPEYWSKILASIAELQHAKNKPLFGDIKFNMSADKQIELFEKVRNHCDVGSTRKAVGKLISEITEREFITKSPDIAIRQQVVLPFEDNGYKFEMNRI